MTPYQRHLKLEEVSEAIAGSVASTKGPPMLGCSATSCPVDADYARRKGLRVRTYAPAGG